jgi:hypothetical protein
MHKITVQYFEPADGDDFVTAYRQRHVPPVRSLPGLERFTISRPETDDAPYLVAERRPEHRPGFRRDGCCARRLGGVRRGPSCHLRRERRGRLSRPAHVSGRKHTPTRVNCANHAPDQRLPSPIDQ